jgi:hypothetical protein
MGVEDLDAYREAKLWFDRRGEQALLALRIAAAEARADGDLDATDRWLRIIAALEDLLRKN